MIAVLHMVIDIAFFTAMTCLFNKRLDELEDTQGEHEERLSNAEYYIEAQRREIGYLLEQAEKQQEEQARL